MKKGISFKIIIFTIIGILGAVFVAGMVSTPLIHAQHSVEKISGGDLTQLINIHTGIKELKLLGSSIDTDLIPMLSKIIKGILNSVKVSGNINKIMQNYSRDSEGISIRINEDVIRIDKEMSSLDIQISEVSAAVTQILATIENLVTHISGQTTAVEQTSAAIEEMTASINSIAKIAGEKSESTRGLMHTVETGRNKVSVSNEQIKEAVGKMGNVLEAGGESEKAFKNVAEEVKNFVNAFAEISQSTTRRV